MIALFLACSLFYVDDKRALSGDKNIKILLLPNEKHAYLNYLDFIPWTKTSGMRWAYDSLTVMLIAHQ